MISRNPVRLAPPTHYVGDLRVVNDEALGAYQLKSLVSLLDTDPPIGNTTIVSTVDYKEDGFYGSDFKYRSVLECARTWHCLESSIASHPRAVCPRRPRLAADALILTTFSPRAQLHLRADRRPVAVPETRAGDVQQNHPLHRL